MSPDDLLHDASRFPREGRDTGSEVSDSADSTASSNSKEGKKEWGAKGTGSGTVRQYPHGSTLLHEPTLKSTQMTIKDIDELAGTIRLSELEASLDLEEEKVLRVSDVLRGSFMDEMLEEAMKDV